MLGTRLKLLFFPSVFLVSVVLTLSLPGGWTRDRTRHILLTSDNGRKSFQAIPKSAHQLNCPFPHGCKGNLTNLEKLRLKRIQRSAVQDYGAHFSVENYMPPQLLELAKLAQLRNQNQNQQVKVENEAQVPNLSPEISQIHPNQNLVQNQNLVHRNLVSNQNLNNQNLVQPVPENAQATFAQKSGYQYGSHIHEDNEEQELDEAIATAAAKLQQAYADQLAQSSQIMDKFDEMQPEHRSENLHTLEQGHNSFEGKQMHNEIRPQHEIQSKEQQQLQHNYDQSANDHFQQQISPIVPTPIPDWPPNNDHHAIQRSGELGQNNYYAQQSHPRPVYHPSQDSRQKEESLPPIVQNFEFTLDPDGSLIVGQSRERNFVPEASPEVNQPQEQPNYHTNEQQDKVYHPQSRPSSEHPEYPNNPQNTPPNNGHFSHENRNMNHETQYSQPIYPGPQPPPPFIHPDQSPETGERVFDPSFRPQSQEHNYGPIEPRPSPTFLQSPSLQTPITLQKPLPNHIKPHLLLPGSKILTGIPIDPKFHGPHPQLNSFQLNKHQGPIFSPPPKKPTTTAIIATSSNKAPTSRADFDDYEGDGWSWDSEPYTVGHTHHISHSKGHTHHKHYHLKKKEELFVLLAAEVAWKIITSYIFVFIANAVIGIIGKVLGLSDSYLETKITLGKDARHPFEHYGSGSYKASSKASSTGSHAGHGYPSGHSGGQGKGHGHSHPPQKDVYYPLNPIYHPSSALYYQPTYQYYPKGKEHTMLGYDQHHALKYAKKYSKKYSKKAHKYGLKPKPIMPYIPAFNYGHQSIAWGRDDSDKVKGELAPEPTAEKADKLGKAKSSEEKSKEQEQGEVEVGNAENKSKGESDEGGSSSASGDAEDADTDDENEQNAEQSAEGVKEPPKVDVVEVELVDPKSVSEEEQEEEDEEEEDVATTLSPPSDNVGIDHVITESSISTTSRISSSIPPVHNVTEEVLVISTTPTSTPVVITGLSTEATSISGSLSSTLATNSSIEVKTNVLRRNLSYRQGRPLSFG